MSTRGWAAIGHRPFARATTMLAAMLMAAACSAGSGEGKKDRAPTIETARAIPAGQAFGEPLGRPAESLEETLPGLLDRPGSTKVFYSAANRTAEAYGSAAAVYRDLEYRPLWVTRNGRFTARGALLLDRLMRAGEDALDPAAYRIEAVGAAMAQGGNVGLSAAELMLSDALVHYAADLWDRKDMDFSILSRAAGAKDFGAFLDGLAPADIAYRRLRSALVEYNSIAMDGGW